MLSEQVKSKLRAASYFPGLKPFAIQAPEYLIRISSHLQLFRLHVENLLNQQILDSRVTAFRVKSDPEWNASNDRSDNDGDRIVHVRLMFEFDLTAEVHGNSRSLSGLLMWSAVHRGQPGENGQTICIKLDPSMTKGQHTRLSMHISEINLPTLETLTILPYSNPAHRAQVIPLWETVFGYQAAHNTPALAIDKKLAVKDGLFFVALIGQTVVGTIMAGYDGHRGWIYSVAVSPDRQRQGIGTQLLTVAETALRNLGCMKINLQVMPDNEKVTAFYKSLGYDIEERISMGKKVAENMPT